MSVLIVCTIEYVFEKGVQCAMGARSRVAFYYSSASH